MTVYLGESVSTLNLTPRFDIKVLPACHHIQQIHNMITISRLRLPNRTLRTLPKLPLHNPRYRTMASSAKCEWIVILPDKKDALPRRMEALKPDIDGGFWLMGGATLDAVPGDAGYPLKINGSVMMALARSRDEVMEKLREDVYFRRGVWDESKIQIFPFKSAFRKAQL
ncbi:hypothetical protein LTR28_009487 [Elasticomyces elasticus]|nr:hypothetical protein LTR28_009487 [Elasticomyces elasticus]